MKNIPIKLLFISLILSGCGISQTPSFQSAEPATSMFDQTSLPQKGEQIAIMQTTKGTIKIKFFPQYAPETVKNFVELSKKGFYDGLIFHRVIPDFMIQGGDPLGLGIGGETHKGPGTKLQDELVPELRHLYGTLSMANAGPNTGTSQFFIVQAKTGTPHLNGKHAIFGQVFEGMDVVDAIANVKKDVNDKPLQPVKIEKITIQPL